MVGVVGQVAHRFGIALKDLFRHPSVEYVDLVGAQGLRVVCHREFPSDVRIEAAWNHLLNEVPGSTVFHSPTWLRGVYESQRNDALRLLTVWDGLRLVAVLPLQLTMSGALESMGHRVSDYLDPLILPKCEDRAWSALLGVLAKRDCSSVGTLTLHNVRDGSPGLAGLCELARAKGYGIDYTIEDNCPAIVLPTHWDGYLDTLNGHERKEIRRKLRKAWSQGNARIETSSGADAFISNSLETAFRLMEQAPGAKGNMVSQVLRPFLERVAPPLIAAGQMWLTTLHIGDEPAAVTIEFPHRDGPMLYNCGFDLAKREWSAGVVLTAKLIERAIETGAKTFDLLRGEEAYKYKLGAVNRPIWSVKLSQA